MEDTHVGMFPLTLQVFHNNFSDGIRRIGFFYEKGRFFVELTEGEKTQRIAIGLTGVQSCRMGGKRGIVSVRNDGTVCGE